MKTFVILFAMGLLGQVAQAADYTCKSAFSDTGHDGSVFSVKVSPAAKSVTLTGTMMVDDKAYPQQCKAQLKAGAKTQGGYTYYAIANTGKACAWDYARIGVDLVKNGQGPISLVSRTGGDDHDWSGYDYLYLTCAAK